jgi:hypothetical protein
MSDTPSGRRPPQHAEWGFKKIAEIVDGVISEEMVRHYDCTTQEHQLTSKLASALERELNRLQVGPVNIQVLVQDLPDRGRGSLEKPVGADLYISIVLPDDASKGILVQSKWDSAVLNDRAQLREQARKMLARSPESYVWVYEPSGISCFPAHDVLGPRMTRENVKTPGVLIADGCRCKAGDRRIGRNPDLPPDQSLRTILEELRVNTGLSLIVQS